MSIELMPAAQVHCTLLAGMHKICFADPWTEGGFAASLDSADTTGLIAVDNNSLQPSAGESGPAGMVMWRMVADEAEILTIAVLPPWRRQGLGQRLLQAALSVISHNSHSVFLEVADNNPAAQELYRKHGFVQVGRRSGYYAGGTDALVMQLDIV